MRVLIIGAGAIGLWLGAYLVRSHNQVTFVGRPKITEAITRNGLMVTQANGQKWTVDRFSAVTSVNTAITMHKDRCKGFDLVIFTVKAYSLAEAVQHVALVWKQIVGDGPQQSTQPVLVCFQNGVGSEEIIAEAFGRENVVSATTTSPVVMSSPGLISEARADGCICLAPISLQNKSGKTESAYQGSHPRKVRSLERVADSLRTAEMDVRQYDDHRRLKWSKMLLNMLGNATGAILDMPAVELYRDARVFDLEMRMLRETRQVMKRLRIRPLDLPHFPAALMSLAVEIVPRLLLRPILRRRLVSGRGDKRPSFYYELVRRTGQSEVQWLNGSVAQYGESLSIATPVNTRLTMVLSDLMAGRQQPTEWRGQVKKLVDGLI
jgi:2-dehydropantoate 2-reductase